VNDPSKLDVSDYFGAAVTGIIAGIGGAMAWFIGAKNKITERMDTQERDLKIRLDGQDVELNKHTTQLAVIHTNQDHMSNRLDEIRECTNTTNEKLGDLSETLTQVLLAVKKH
jgi:hypothetical protein